MIVAAATIAATAQSLTFKCDGKVINNGETYYSTSTNETYNSMPQIHEEIILD